MNVYVAYSLRMTLVFVKYNQFNWIGWPSSQCLRTFVCTCAHTCTCTLYTCMYMYIVHMHVHVHTLELILTLNTILPYHNTQLLTHFTCIQRSHLLMLSPWHIHTFLSLSPLSCIYNSHTHKQSAVAGGLCGEEAVAKKDDQEDITNASVPNSVPLVAPLDLEDRSAFTSSGSRPVFSRLSRFTNSILKPGVGGVVRSGSVAGSPKSQRKMTTDIAAISENE